jgi:RNA polymerase sigma factor (sigma-70 family)
MALTCFECGHAELPTLLEDAQTDPADDTPAMNEIVRRFEPLTQKIAGLLTSSEFLKDDLANEARIALVSAVRHHDLTQPTFAGFAQVYMRGAALRERDRWTYPTSDSSSEPLLVSIESADLTEEIASESIKPPEEEVETRLAPWGDGKVATVVAVLGPKQVELMKRRYIDDAPLQVIASEAGTSSSAVSQRLATIHRKVEVAIAA